MQYISLTVSLNQLLKQKFHKTEISLENRRTLDHEIFYL